MTKIEKIIEKLEASRRVISSSKDMVNGEVKFCKMTLVFRSADEREEFMDKNPDKNIWYIWSRVYDQKGWFPLTATIGKIH